MKCLSLLVMCYHLGIYLKSPHEIDTIMHIGLFAGSFEPRVGQCEKMPKLLHLLETMRAWRIDTPEESSSNLSPSTPIITILPSVEEPEKQKVEKREDVAQSTKNDETEQNPLVSCESFP